MGVTEKVTGTQWKPLKTSKSEKRLNHSIIIEDQGACIDKLFIIKQTVPVISLKVYNQNPSLGLI